MPRNIAWLLVPLFLYGCSSTGMVGELEIQAQQHMLIADTLERASALPKATREYLLVAEHFPSTSVYPKAVRKAAILLGSTSNPAANDSASLFWLEKYLSLTSSPDDKELIRMYLAMADRMTDLRDSLRRQAEQVDSLQALAHRQTTEAASRAHRLQELEAELQQVSTELKKLKEIDIRTSRGRDRNKP